MKFVKSYVSFGVIQNNIALKQVLTPNGISKSFGVIQNNIALKRATSATICTASFGVIQNNIALKLLQRIWTF